MLFHSINFVRRVKENEVKKAEAKTKGVKAVTKRQPVGPRPAHIVKNVTPTELRPVPFQFLQ